MVALQVFHFSPLLERDMMVPRNDWRLAGRYRLPFTVQGRYAIASKKGDTLFEPDTYLVYDWVEDKMAILSLSDPTDYQPVRYLLSPLTISRSCLIPLVGHVHHN